MERRTRDAARRARVHCQVQNRSLTVPPGRALDPLGINKLRLFRMSGAECMRRISQRAQANLFKDQCVLWRDRLKGNHWLASRHGGVTRSQAHANSLAASLA